MNIMRKGLGITLLAISWACVQVSASYGIAPTIAELPDVIVGDFENASDPSTDSNVFVFPDAIDFRTVILNSGDLTTDASNLIWSFWAVDGRFTLNGVGPLTISELTLGLGPAQPPAAKQIQDKEDGGADIPGTHGGPEDGEGYTITFRDTVLSGPSVDPGTGKGEVPGSRTVITAYASTGTTFGERSFVVYSANDTSDTLSGGVDDTLLASFDFKIPANSTNWLSGATLGTGTAQQDNATGICLTVPGPGDNIVLWVSPSDLLPLIDQVAYRLRAFVNSDQSTTDAIPLFNINYDNFHQNIGGFQNYGGERWVWDAGGRGGANGIGRPQGRDVLEVWFAPITMNTTAWRTTNPNGSTAFDTASDDVNDIRITFRVLDLGGGSDPLGATLDSGTICIERMEVSTVPFATLDAKGQDVYSPPLDATTTHFAQTTENLGLYPGVSASITGGNWTVSLGPVGALGIVRATLGPDVVAGGPFQDPGGSGLLNPLRLYPVPWEADTAYMTRAAIRRGAGAGTDPVDVIILNHEAFVAELGGLDFIVPAGADLSALPGRSGLGTDGGGMVLAGAPPVTAEEYVSFFHGNNVSINPQSVVGSDGWKTQVDLFNRGDLGGGNNSGQDQIVVESLTVVKLNLQLLGNN